MLNKKAQIGETMTWIVATVIIIVILVFSIFITQFFTKTSKAQIDLSDKEKDFVATKSIVAFSMNENNLKLIEDSVNNKDYGVFENKAEIFLRNLLSEKEIQMENFGWNLRLFIDNQEKTEILTYAVLGKRFEHYGIILEKDSNIGKIKLRFWEEFQTRWIL